MSTKVLRWEQPSEKNPNWFTAVAGPQNLTVGTIVGRADGEWVYTVDAVHTKWIGKGRGTVKSKASAMRAVERAWRDWCFVYGLEPKSDEQIEQERKELGV